MKMVVEICKLFSLLCLVLMFFVPSFSLPMSHFKVGTLNLNGARDVRKRSTLYELVKLKNIDVMFLQETHSDVCNEVDWKREWGGEFVLSHGSSNSGGVAILFSKCCTPVS